MEERGGGGDRQTERERQRETQRERERHKERERETVVVVVPLRRPVYAVPWLMDDRTDGAALLLNFKRQTETLLF